MWALADRTIGPERPKCVNRSSPNSSKTTLPFGVFQAAASRFSGRGPAWPRSRRPRSTSGTERADRLHDGVAQRCRHPVSVAGRAGQRVGAAAGCQNDRVRGGSGPFAVCTPHTAPSCTAISVARACRTCTPVCAQIALQRGEDVCRAVGHREDAIAALGLQRHSPWTSKNAIGVGRGEARMSALYRKRGFVGVFFKTSSHGQSFVTLQRPLPVM